MTNVLPDQFQIVKVDFDSMSAEKQAEITLRGVAEHLGSIEERINLSHLTNIAADTARYFALEDLHRQVDRVRRQIDVKTLLRTGMIGDHQPDKAVAEGPEATGQYIQTLKFVAKLSPDMRPSDQVSELYWTIEDEQLRFAYQCAQEVIGRFPGFSKFMSENNTYPEDILESYFRTLQPKGRPKKGPEYLLYAVYFMRDMKAWKESPIQGFRDHGYNDAQFWKWPMMDRIRAFALEKKERKAVDQVINYGGGQTFTTSTWF